MRAFLSYWCGENTSGAEIRNIWPNETDRFSKSQETLRFPGQCSESGEESCRNLPVLPMVSGAKQVPRPDLCWH